MGNRANVGWGIGVLGTLSAALVVLGCNGDEAVNGSDGSSGSMGIAGKPTNGGAGGSPGAGGAAGGSGGDACATDPLRTGETMRPHVDDFDCEILTATAKYGEPDAMIFKAIIYAESRFTYDADACSNLPCGTPTGWTDAESHCFGLMQVVPACGGTPNDEGLLSNGHPNLATDQSSPDFATSIFNPKINVDIGVFGVHDNRQQVKKQFSGCTEDQYTLMAIGNYNSYGSTKSCTVYNTAYDDSVLATYRQYAQESGWAAHPY